MIGEIINFSDIFFFFFLIHITLALRFYQVSLGAIRSAEVNYDLNVKRL